MVLGQVNNPQQKSEVSWVPVAHACNLSYTRGRDHEDHSLKPAQANSSVRPYLDKTHHNKGLVEWLKVKALLSSSPSIAKKKKS
jgi:hypothetical protein